MKFRVPFSRKKPPLGKAEVVFAFKNDKGTRLELEMPELDYEVCLKIYSELCSHIHSAKSETPAEVKP